MKAHLKLFFKLALIAPLFFSCKSRDHNSLCNCSPVPSRCSFFCMELPASPDNYLIRGDFSHTHWAIKEWRNDIISRDREYREDLRRHEREKCKD